MREGWTGGIKGVIVRFEIYNSNKLEEHVLEFKTVQK